MMKKSIPPLLAALALLGACAKVETAPSSPDGIAISFSPILGSVRTKADAKTEEGANPAINTKADPAAAELDSRAKFYSYAWYLPDRKKWDTGKAEAKLYIDKAEVSYHEGEVTPFVKEPWHADQVYYWPKGGSLTFLSYSCLRGEAFYPDALTSEGTETTVDKDGLKIENFKLNADQGHPAYDFDLLVADIAKDRRADLNGVPTVFRHKLARISFYVSQEEKTSSQTPQDNYVLTSLKLTNIYTQGDYSGGGYDSDSWSNQQSSAEYSIFSSGTTTNPITVTTDAKQVGPSVNVIPQNLLAVNTGSQRSAPQIIISYTKNGENQEDIKRDLEDLGTNFWDKGKEYKYYITFGSGDKPIDFSGSIGDWNDKDEDKSEVNIGT